MTFHNSTFGTFKQAQKVDKQTEAEQTEPGHQLVRFYLIGVQPHYPVDSSKIQKNELK